MTNAPTQSQGETEPGRFSSWPTSELAAQCRMQARENLDPEYSQFMAAVAERLSSLTPSSDDATVERVARIIAPNAGWEKPDQQWLSGTRREALTTARLIVSALAALPPRPSDDVAAERVATDVMIEAALTVMYGANAKPDSGWPEYCKSAVREIWQAMAPFAVRPSNAAALRDAAEELIGIIGDDSRTYVREAVERARAALATAPRPSDDVAKLREAAIELRDDMLMRARMNKHLNGGQVVVEAGNGAWAKFCAALADGEKSK